MSCGRPGTGTNAPPAAWAGGGRDFSVVAVDQLDHESVPRAILDRGAADGTFDIMDPQVSTMTIIAMLNGMTTWYRENGRLSLDEIEALYVRLVARLVGQKKED